MEHYSGAGSALSAVTSAEFDRPVPRNVRMTLTGWANIVLLAVLFGAALAWLTHFGNEAWRATENRNTLREVTGQATGRITREWIAGKHLTHYIGYVFEVNGTSYTGESSVPAKIWQSWKDPDKVNIKFAPSDPTINHPANWEASVFGLWLLLIIAIFPAFLGFVISNELVTQRRLLTFGIPAVATVTACEKRNNLTRYEYQTQSGATLKGACGQAKKVDIGSNLLIVYLPDSPRTNRIYDIETFRIV